MGGINLKPTIDCPLINFPYGETVDRWGYGHFQVKNPIPELNRQLEKEAQENSRRRIIFLKDVKSMQNQNKTTLINGHDFPD